MCATVATTSGACWGGGVSNPAPPVTTLLTGGVVMVAGVSVAGGDGVAIKGAPGAVVIGGGVQGLGPLPLRPGTTATTTSGACWSGEGVSRPGPPETALRTGSRDDWGLCGRRRWSCERGSYRRCGNRRRSAGDWSVGQSVWPVDCLRRGWANRWSCCGVVCHCGNCGRRWMPRSHRRQTPVTGPAPPSCG